MESPPAPTRTRLLDAATAEFAAFGLAGGRVDRIASSAGANKQLIYAYFDSKVGLFDRVIETQVAGLLDIVSFDAHDLAGYCLRLHDFYVANEPLLRLAGWCRLERPGSMESTPVAQESMRSKSEALSRAIDAGDITTDLEPEQLLRTVLALTESAAHESLTASDATAQARIRTALTAAVSKLVA